MDNYAIDWAMRYGGKGSPKEILPVFSFDPRFYQTKVEDYGSLKCGLVRARFIRETVINLRQKLQALGSQLLVTQEKPEVFLPKLIRP